MQPLSTNQASITTHALPEANPSSNGLELSRLSLNNPGSNLPYDQSQAVLCYSLQTQSQLSQLWAEKMAVVEEHQRLLGAQLELLQKNQIQLLNKLTALFDQTVQQG